MFTGIKELYAYRELIGIWAEREIRARYSHSVLGVVWAIFQPLAFMIIYAFVFTRILRVDTDEVPYLIFIYVGQLPWSFFARGLLGAVPSIVANMNLVTKIYVPRATFPLAAIATYFVDFLCGIVVLVLLMIYYQTPLKPAMPFVLVLLFIQILLMSGLGLFFAAINVRFRDINQMLPLLLQLFFYACPIIYPVSLVPESLRSLYMLNPIAVLVEGYRQIIFNGTLPDPAHLALAAALALVAFIIGFTVFRNSEDQFADII
jgi:ABC-type polysaccharide/polyol phosphate export permease